MKNNNTSINEIRPKIDLCIKGLWIEIILACAVILSSILIDLTLLSFVFIMPILILFTCLDYKNTCVVYDQNRITITNFMNRHFSTLGMMLYWFKIRIQILAFLKGRLI